MGGKERVAVVEFLGNHEKILCRVVSEVRKLYAKI